MALLELMLIATVLTIEGCAVCVQVRVSSAGPRTCDISIRVRICDGSAMRLLLLMVNLLWIWLQRCWTVRTIRKTTGTVMIMI